MFKNFSGIEGYLADEFILKNSNNKIEFSGSISDKKFKLDVILIKKLEDTLHLEIGSYLEIVGDLQRSGNIFYNH